MTDRPNDAMPEAAGGVTLLDAADDLVQLMAKDVDRPEVSAAWNRLRLAVRRGRAAEKPSP